MLQHLRKYSNPIHLSQDPSAFELALAEVDWESASVVGIIVNFVCRNLLWGTWVTHHFYAIVKGRDTLKSAEDAPGAERGGVPASEGENRSVEDGGGGGGVGLGGGESDGEEGGGGCFKRLSPGKRRAKMAARSRDGGGGGSGDGEEKLEGATRAVWYSLDSRLLKPQRLGRRRGLLAHLAWEVREHHGHVFVVGKGIEARDERSDDDGTNLPGV